MKTFFSQHPVLSASLKFFGFLLIVSACADDPEIVPVKPEQALQNSDEMANARQSNSNGQEYNLNVLLLPNEKNHAMGFVKFRQHEDGAQFINLDTWVHGLEPNTNYLLQRAVDTVLDGNCTGITWITLGKGLDPFPIATNSWGMGKAELFRSVSAIAVGTSFDIHFQIVKESTMEVVLTSDCYQYTVR